MHSNFCSATTPAFFCWPTNIPLCCGELTVSKVQTKGRKGNEIDKWTNSNLVPRANRSPWPAVGKRELWEHPSWSTKANNRILVIWLTAQSQSASMACYGACFKWMLPELLFSSRWSGGMKLWERDWANSYLTTTWGNASASKFEPIPRFSDFCSYWTFSQQGGVWASFLCEHYINIATIFTNCNYNSFILISATRLALMCTFVTENH